MLKRIFDLLIIVLGIPLWTPLVGIVAILVRKQLGSPVFFCQARGGLKGEVFSIIKFRTMTDDLDSNGGLLHDAQRLTKLGIFLRRSSLDELPSLFNVLIGQLSLVGPRPFLAEYLALYTPEQARRHDVRPGITGWAQVNGRNAISWEDKFLLDLWYVDNQSFWLDIKILWLTAKKILVRDGISAEGEVTMPRFTGNNTREDRP
jgi:lipopolysaccharide/colanic/teichoic acid biosynthesis glycosyltransferase